MLIEDEELRGIFQEASEDGLRKIREGLTQLRDNPDDQDLLDGLLRESHSLKGNAGMLGLKDIATLTQQWEHLLSQVQKGKAAFDEDLERRLGDGLGALEALVQEAITGEPSGVQTFYVLAQLMGSGETASSSSPKVAQTPQRSDALSLPAVEEPPAPSVPQPVLEPTSDDGAIDELLSRLELGLVALEEDVADPEARAQGRQRERLDSLFKDLEVLEQLTGNDPRLRGRINGWKHDLAQLMEGEDGLDAGADRLYEGLDAIRDYFRPGVASAPGMLTPPVAVSVGPQLRSVNYIEDEELRHTFQLASQDHLQKLYDGLLSLEQSPGDRVQLDDILREIHSLKGDAGMLGVTAVAQLAHDWEQALASVKSGEMDLTGEGCDELLRGLDRIRQCIDQAVSLNESRESSVPETLAVPPGTESRYLEDEELRQTFQVATEDHLQKLWMRACCIWNIIPRMRGNLMSCCGKSTVLKGMRRCWASRIWLNWPMSGNSNCCLLRRGNSCLMLLCAIASGMGLRRCNNWFKRR